MTSLRYGIVGTGHRAEMYVRSILDDHSDVATIVALSDPNPGRIDYYTELITAAGREAPSRWAPDQFEEMIAVEKLDRVIITSPDVAHADLVVRALHAGVDVIVEKPLTIDAAGCSTIAEAAESTGRQVIVTFNYRYSPRNSALKALIASGAIGRVTSVAFEWVLDTAHGADYFRRWHRDKANSGGLLIHKASHHFDLVNWWIADAPCRVFASGGLRFYGAENAEARGLGARSERGTHDGERGPFELDLRDDARLKRLYLDTEHFDGYHRDQDVFGDGITIEDNLAIVVDYSGGATLSYSLNAHSPWEGYRVMVNGTEGRAELEVVERGAVIAGEDDRAILDPSAAADRTSASPVRPAGERLVLQKHWQEAEIVEIPMGEGSHGGGDALLLSDLFRGPGDDPLDRPSDYRDGIRSVAVGIAGNASLTNGQPVEIDALTLGIRVASAAGAAR